MNALNDLAMIKLETKRFAGTGKETAEDGILVGLPDFTHYGFWSFAFDGSVMNKELATKLFDYWYGKIGRRVYWTALSERGNIIETTDGTFAFVKLTSLIADDDPENEGRNVHSEGSGSFGLEQ